MISKSLIVFLPAGYPSKERTLEFMLSANADIFEIGIPFSDPIADGETIQNAYFKALSSGFRVDDVFWIARRFLEIDERDLILMSYFNPIYRHGLKKFVEKAYGSGFKAILVVDLPFDEAGEFFDICRDFGIGNIFLAAPNTSEERLRIIDELSTFIYLVSTYGVTGEREKVSEIAFKALNNAKKVCKKPIAVGFGVSKKNHVDELFKAGADGVVVGSAVVKLIEECGERAEKEIAKFTSKLKN
ncbi:MAG: tryptophan synthase subunit alpha [Archaeoglobaceae archaeon]|nr:tryptophan synthase subunit alpha [Archaeoglobaceae archaeon]MDW7989397.1 tryptophan synthase subunit alpha [Archaeoglobaceae archaeon]